MFSFLTRQDLSERDQKAAKESFEAFKELVSRFPDSRYTPDARQRMNYIVNSLAQYEVHVARYYYSAGAYLAAINRAQIALADYRECRRSKRRCTSWSVVRGAGHDRSCATTRSACCSTNYPNSGYLTPGLQAANEPWWKIW